MATTQEQKSDSAQTQDVAIDVRANDLVHIGTDNHGHNHYYDKQRDRILVVDGKHDEYTRDGSALVRRSLVVGATNVEHIQTEGNTDALDNYIKFIHEDVESREWERIETQLVDLNGMLAGIGGA